MMYESTLNPGKMQGGYSMLGGKGGFGLVQWTPYAKYTNWAAKYGYTIGKTVNDKATLVGHIYPQACRIYLEMLHGTIDGVTQYANNRTNIPQQFRIDRLDFWQNPNLTVYNCAGAFLYLYERPTVQSAKVLAERTSAAASVYNYITSGTMPTPIDRPPGGYDPGNSDYPMGLPDNPDTYPDFPENWPTPPPHKRYNYKSGSQYYNLPILLRNIKK